MDSSHAATGPEAYSPEASAGVIVFHDGPGGRRRWLTLLHRKGHWDFAKGHVEPGETVRQAAVRELHEETGIGPGQIELFEGFARTIQYRFTKRSGRGVHKTVRYFLARSHTSDVTLSHESEAFAWLPRAQCLERLSYQTARDVLADAAAFVEAAPIR